MVSVPRPGTGKCDSCQHLVSFLDDLGRDKPLAWTCRHPDRIPSATDICPPEKINLLPIIGAPSKHTCDRYKPLPALCSNSRPATYCVYTEIGYDELRQTRVWQSPRECTAYSHEEALAKTCMIFDDIATGNFVLMYRRIGLRHLVWDMTNFPRHEQKRYYTFSANGAIMEITVTTNEGAQ